MQRFLAIGFVLAIAALAGGYFAFARQSVYRVTGPSMAPALLGPHYDVVCPACGHAFAIDATRGPIPTALCDYCGARAPVKTADDQPGDAIEPRSGEVERFDLVMFPDPANPSQQVVKRVVGLPGETIAGKQGDLWINGKRYQKSWEEFRRVAVPVFATYGQIELAPPHVVKGMDGRIVYRHQVHSQGIQLSGDAPPLNDYPYNQGLPGKLEPISDLGLIAEWQVDVPQLELTIVHRDGQWAKRLVPKETSGEMPPAITVGIALCDGRVITCCGDDVSVEEVEPAKPELAAAPLWLRAEGDGWFHQLRIVRDLRYADFPETKIPADAYFVLGDNVIASRDSRHFGPISAKQARRMIPASRPD